MEFENEHDEEHVEQQDNNEDEITISPLATTLAPTRTIQVPTELNSVIQPSQPGRVGGSSSVARYMECLKNHASGTGGLALDGCGEFMAGGPEGSIAALHCAACNCHRNFHRKETLDDGVHGGIGCTQALTTTPNHIVASPTNALYPHLAAYYQTSHPGVRSGSGSGYGYGPYNYYNNRPVVTFPAAPSSNSGGTMTYSGDDMSHPSNSGGGGSGSAGKRFRTKFSPEQKQKMSEFAEKLGWRIQKHDDDVVKQFCEEIQVKRQVFKVWMHNNKYTLGKKP